MAAAINEFRARLRAASWWLVPLLVAVALIAWETDFGRQIRRLPPPEEPVAPRPVVASLLPEYEIGGGVAARADTVQRTLFNPTRRPAPVLLVDPSKAKLQRGQFALTGTMVIAGKNTAFLKETAGGKSRRVLQGDMINGILVADVKPDRVRLALGDESEELVLRVATNPRPTAPPPAPGAPGAPGSAPVPAPGLVPPPAQAAAAGAAAPAGSADASLAERRRAARAAQAAAAAQGAAPDANAVPPAAAAPTPAAQAAAAAAAVPPGADPRWNDVYRRYQNGRATPAPK